MPLTAAPIPFRRRRRPVRTLTLVAAAYDFAGHVIDLTFDRPIDIADMDVTPIVIDDSDSGNRYQGSGTPTLLNTRTVRVTTTLVGPVSVPNTFLTAGPATHLEALDDDGKWAGVTSVQVPFG